jgi:pimeloyl-ACP methyl ester carboxylesterase
MQELTAAQIDAQARAIVERANVPRRRARPRIIEALRELPLHWVPTSYGEVAAWRLGQGPAVMLVHGWEDDHGIWSRLIDALRARGHAAVAIDLPGHGMSKAEDASILAFAAAIRAVNDAVGPTKAIVAHSMGVSGALAALDQGLAVEGFVSIAPPLPTRPELIKTRPLTPNVPPAVQQRVVELHAERRQKRAATFAIDPEAVAARQEGRALFLHDTGDEIWQTKSSELIAASWPRARYEETVGLGHRNIARDAGVIERIVDFIEASSAESEDG